MSNKSGIQKCIEAFERLKNNTPNNPDFKDLKASEITKSKVSQEAGLDKGFLKSSRRKHITLIGLIEEYRKNKSSTLSQNEKLNREKRKAERYKKERDDAVELYHQSLGRELLLISKVRELELLLGSSNVIKLK